MPLHCYNNNHYYSLSYDLFCNPVVLCNFYNTTTMNQNDQKIILTVILFIIRTLNNLKNLKIVFIYRGYACIVYLTKSENGIIFVDKY